MHNKKIIKIGAGCLEPEDRMLEAALEPVKPQSGDFTIISADQVKAKSVQGGVITLAAQGLSFVLQTGTLMILARLLSPKDFGLQGMALVITGFLGLFRDIGLGAAIVQRDKITHEQLSTLFWVNLAVGAALTILTAILAPVVAAFYHEPDLLLVTVVLGLTFVISSVTAQHGALLQRNMQFVTITKINVISSILSSALGIGMAALGYRYWALVAMPLSGTIMGTIGLWILVSWRPGKPRRGCGIRSMLHFGGIVTCNSLVVYLGYNAEKILLGRFWGAEALGLYGRAFQLLNLPLQQLHSSIFGVAFSALSRIQNEPKRLCRSFLKGYSVVVSVTLPITITSALFADEVIQIVLGSKWMQAAPILRLLTPAILSFSMINPFGWFLIATGRTVRSLKIALLIAPTVVLGILAGIRHGPQGVALGYSLAMLLLIVPVIVWAIHKTEISAREYWQTAQKPLLSGLLAILCGLVFNMIFGDLLAPIPRLIIGAGIVFAFYFWILLFVLKEKELYMDLFNQVIQRFRDKRQAR